MTAAFTLEPVDSVTITTLMDNVSDALLVNQGPARRVVMGTVPRVPAPTMEGGTTSGAFVAEHGFSALVTVARGGRNRTLLFDTGVSPGGMLENMRRLSLTPKDAEAIVLSHGHFDHTGGMSGLVEELGRAHMPVIVHPEFWNRRRVVFPGREPVELPTTSKSALRGAGFEVTEERQPSFLLDRCLLVTGEVDRTTEFERGMPNQEKAGMDGWEPDPLILDDQAVIVHLRGRGLVVMTGCGHAGIVNIVRYAQRLTGVQGIHAVLGGFHLGGPLFEPTIPLVVEELRGLSPAVLVPAHCTGWRAIHALAAAFPEAFIQNSVGTVYEFEASSE